MQPKSILITFEARGEFDDKLQYHCITERVIADVGRGDPSVFDEDIPLKFEDGVWFTDGCDVFNRLIGCWNPKFDEKLLKQFIDDSYKALNNIKSMGDSARVSTKIGEMDFDVCIAASLDFPDITADSKEKLGEDSYKVWYEKWADLLDRRYIYPAVRIPTNAEKFREAPLKDVIAYAAGAGMTVEEWLSAPSK